MNVVSFKVVCFFTAEFTVICQQARDKFTTALIPKLNTIIEFLSHEGASFERQGCSVLKDSNIIKDIINVHTVIEKF